MADLDGYQQWLAKQQRQPSFINNQWCLMLTREIEANKSLERFNIPYFIVEEQLSKEDNNVNLENKDDAYVSPALRHWLIYLLKTFSSETNANNYEEVLRDFLEKDGVLPIGIARPLTASTSFHNLPSECKLWILHALWNNKREKLSEAPSVISEDPLGNAYHITEGRLYVRLAKTDGVALPIDAERLKDQPWESLYRFVHEERCKLLCDSREGWEVVGEALLSFKLNKLYDAIRPEMTAELGATNSIKEEERADSENAQTILTPISNARTFDKDKISSRKPCRFGTGCNRKSTCHYQHPADNLNQVGGSSCKYASRCTRVGCRFIHPEECIAPCPTPGACRKYHRPARAIRPHPGPGPRPGFPGAPGYPPIPRFPPPNVIRYGFGPDSSYRPAPEPGPGIPQNQPGPSVYKLVRNHAPSTPPPAPRPTTPGLQPPPCSSRQ